MFGHSCLLVTIQLPFLFGLFCIIHNLVARVITLLLQFTDLVKEEIETEKKRDRQACRGKGDTEKDKRRYRQVEEKRRLFQYHVDVSICMTIYATTRLKLCTPQL